VLLELANEARDVVVGVALLGSDVAPEVADGRLDSGHFVVREAAVLGHGGLERSDLLQGGTDLVRDVGRAGGLAQLADLIEHLAEAEGEAVLLVAHGLELEGQLIDLAGKRAGVLLDARLLVVLRRRLLLLLLGLLLLLLLLLLLFRLLLLLLNGAGFLRLLSLLNVSSFNRIVLLLLLKKLLLLLIKLLLLIMLLIQSFFNMLHFLLYLLREVRVRGILGKVWVGLNGYGFGGLSLSFL
jgi:hypothetical protein